MGARAAARSRSRLLNEVESVVISVAQVLAVAGDVIHARLGSEFFAESERIIVAEILREDHGLSTVAGRVGDEVADVNSVHRAGVDTGWEPIDFKMVHAKSALTHRSLTLGHGELRAVVVEIGGDVGLFLPVEHPDAIGAGRHAHPTPDAHVLVDHDHTVGSVVGRHDRAHLDAGCILTFHAQHRHGVGFPLGIPHLVDLDPFS